MFIDQLPAILADYLPVWMFLALTIFLMAGFPVTFTLLGTGLIFGLIGFGPDLFNLLPLRIMGVMGNVTLIAVPLFVFMGVMLEKSGLARELLETMGLAFNRINGGLAISVVLVGALLGASTGVVGATVVTMGVLSIPSNASPGLQHPFSDRYGLRVRHPRANHPTLNHSGFTGRYFGGFSGRSFHGRGFPRVNSCRSLHHLYLGDLHSFPRTGS